MNLSLREVMNALNIDPRDTDVSPRSPSRRTIDAPIRAVSTDTRSLKRGDLFVALKGPNFDGHRFLNDAFDQGACAAVVEQGGYGTGTLPNNGYLLEVPDTLVALGRIGRMYLLKWSIKVVALTGSSGKTTTKEMVFNILKRYDKVVATEKNYNNRIGVPRTIFRCDESTKFLILEMGTNEPGEIKKLCDIAKPDVALITNIGTAHIGKFKSHDELVNEKWDIFRAIKPGGLAIINADDDTIRRLSKSVGGVPVRYSLNCDTPYTVTKLERIDGGLDVTLDLNGERCHFQLPMIAKVFVSDALAAATIAHSLGVPVTIIAAGLADPLNAKWRMQTLKTRGGKCVIVDCYNANPESMYAAIEAVLEMRGSHKTCVVLGDMFELGDQAAAYHTEVGTLLKRPHVSCVVTVGRVAEHFLTNADVDKTYQFQTTDAAANKITEITQEYDLILIKGSRGMQMEKLLPLIDKF